MGSLGQRDADSCSPSCGFLVALDYKLSELMDNLRTLPLGTPRGSQEVLGSCFLVALGNESLSMELSISK